MPFGARGEALPAASRGGGGAKDVEGFSHGGHARHEDEGAGKGVGGGGDSGGEAAGKSCRTHGDAIASARVVDFAAVALRASGKVVGEDAGGFPASNVREGMFVGVEGVGMLGKRSQRLTESELEAGLALAARECDSWVCVFFLGCYFLVFRTLLEIAQWPTNGRVGSLYTRVDRLAEGRRGRERE